jgi:hypothetical protein
MKSNPINFYQELGISSLKSNKTEEISGRDNDFVW